MREALIAPSLKTTAGCRVTSTIVDGCVFRDVPPSMTRSNWSLKYSEIIEMSLAAGSPEILALVAVIGNPAARTRSSAKDSPGIRTAILSAQVI